MLTKEKISEILREKYPYLNSEYGVKRLGLFGSYAKGEQTEDSDVDIVAEFEKPIGLKFIELAEYIEKILGKEADILTREGLKQITAKKIIRDIEKTIIYV
jgi:predicted nucleotidyltransferase